jgi:endonuclease YncB( thermonuclease family)
MKRLSILIVTFLSITVSLTQTVLTGKVIGIKYGDTVVVIDSNKTQTTLRLAEVDCPKRTNHSAPKQNNSHQTKSI